MLAPLMLWYLAALFWRACTFLLLLLYLAWLQYYSDLNFTQGGDQFATGHVSLKLT